MTHLPNEKSEIIFTGYDRISNLLPNYSDRKTKTLKACCKLQIIYIYIYIYIYLYEFDLLPVIYVNTLIKLTRWSREGFIQTIKRSNYQMNLFYNASNRINSLADLTDYYGHSLDFCCSEQTTYVQFSVIVNTNYTFRSNFIRDH